jgi:hypothetical protein
MLLHNLAERFRAYKPDAEAGENLDLLQHSDTFRNNAEIQPGREPDDRPCHELFVKSAGIVANKSAQTTRPM